MILLIDNYDSFTFNLVHYLGGLGAKVAVHRNDKITVKDVIAASTEAIAIYDTAGRSELAQRARESARQEFHCAGF